MQTSLFLVNVNSLEAFNTTVPEAMAAGCIPVCYEAVRRTRLPARRRERRRLPEPRRLRARRAGLRLMADESTRRSGAAAGGGGRSTASSFPPEATAQALGRFFAAHPAMKIPPIGFGCSPVPRREGGASISKRRCTWRRLRLSPLRPGGGLRQRARRGAGVALQSPGGLFLVGKVWRTNFRPEALRQACESSLRAPRLRCFRSLPAACSRGLAARRTAGRSGRGGLGRTRAARPAARRAGQVRASTRCRSRRPGKRCGIWRGEASRGALGVSNFGPAQIEAAPRERSSRRRTRSRALPTSRTPRPWPGAGSGESASWLTRPSRLPGSSPSRCCRSWRSGIRRSPAQIVLRWNMQTRPGAVAVEHRPGPHRREPADFELQLTGRDGRRGFPRRLGLNSRMKLNADPKRCKSGTSRREPLLPHRPRRPVSPTRSWRGVLAEFPQPGRDDGASSTTPTEKKLGYSTNRRCAPTSAISSTMNSAPVAPVPGGADRHRRADPGPLLRRRGAAPDPSRRLPQGARDFNWHPSSSSTAGSICWSISTRTGRRSTAGISSCGTAT